MAETPETSAKPTATKTGFDLELCRKRFKQCVDAESELRLRQLDDQKFFDSDQWDPLLKAGREAEKRPCLTINRTRGGVKQITNEQRQSPPAIQVNPVDDKADIDTAEVFQGLIRNIETRSRAAIAYQTAGEQQAKIGLGYFRLVSQYVDDTSDDQEILIKRVLNRFAVHLDPAAVEFDKADARFGFIRQMFSKAEYKSRWPDSKLAELDEFSSLGDDQSYWIQDGQVSVVEYFYVTTHATQLGLFRDAQGQPQYLVEADWPKNKKPERSRRIERKAVKWCKTNGLEELEATDLPGTRIPIIPVVGEESVDQHGQVDYRGVVRDAKDPQRILNAMESGTVEQIGLGPRAPWIVVAKAIKGLETFWKTANSRNWSYLPWHSHDESGNPLPKPERNVIEPPIQATVIAAQRAENNHRAVMGFIDVHGEEHKSEQSGRAILARQHQAETGNLNYLDNLSRAVQSCGALLIEWIPYYYDAPRVVRILGLDDQPKTVMVHAGNAPDLGQTDENAFLQQRGIKGIYDLAVGRYDVTVSSGPSYQTKRQEAFEMMSEWVKAFPPSFPISADILAANIDAPWGRTLAERYKKALPPQFQDKEGAPEIPPQVAQKLQSYEQLIDQQTKIVNELILEKKTEGMKLEGQIKLQQMKDAASIAVAWINARTKGVLSEQESIAEAIALAQTQAHDALQAMLDRQHEVGQAAAGAGAAADQSAQAHDQTLEAGDQAHGQALEQLAAQPSDTGAGT